DSWGAGLEIVELGGAENGTAYLGFGGVILFSPDPNYAGPASFSYTAIDGEGNAAMAVVTLDVMQVPDFPSALPDFLLGTEDTPLVIGVSELTGNDFSEDFLSVIGVSSGPGGTAVLSEDGQTVLFTPDADFVGQASFVYAVAGGAGSVSATAYIDVAPANAGPVANPDVLECDRNGTATFEVQALLANDYDNEGDAFTLVEVGDATSGSVALSEDGSTITFTPATGFQGFATFSYTLADSRGATSVGQAAVNVAGPPAVADDAFLVREDQKFFLDSAQLLLNDSDPEGQALQVVSVGDATHGTVYLGWGGMISFDPDPDYNGPASFTYTAADASGRTAEATVTLEVQSVDDSPRAAADFFTGVEDTPLFIRVADLLANDWNDDSLTRIVAVEFAQGGTAVLSGDRETILFTPDADFTGQANFQYLVGDGAGFMGTTAYVEVAARNDAPYTEPDALWTSEGVPITYDVQTLLGNDWDRDGDPFELVAVAAGAGGNVVLNQDGTFTFTPTAGFFGDAAFSYVVRDSQGAAAAGQVSVHVGAVNDAPTAVDDFFQASEDTPLQIEIAQLLGNDTDPEGDLLTLDGVGEASNGWAGFDGNTVTFVPDPDYSGPATFSYYGRDAGGIAFSGTVMLDIGARDDAPRSRPDEVEAVEDTPLVIDVADLLGNDWNDDSWASISNVRGAANGTVALSADGSTILFTPDADFIGDAYFEYDVRDATNPSGMGSYVMVHVAGRNDAPIARPDLLTVHEDQPAVFDASDLLANDSDVDGDEVTLVGLATGTGGTVELNEDGTFTFSPAAGFSGDASFSYTFRASGGATSTGPAIVQVQPVDDGPTAVDDAYFVYEDAPFWVDATELVANDTDPENDVLTVFAAENASHGWVHFDGVGVTFMPDLDYSGPATFTYWARDASGNTTSATVSLDVSPQDDVPRPEFDEVEAVEDTPLVIDVAQLLANDWDDDDLTSITEVGSGYGGTATLSMDRTTILFTPDADFTGQASFIYELNGGEDHGGASSYVNVHVAARNDAPVAVADTLVAYEDQAMVFGTHALLDNDSDVDGGGLELVSVTTGTGGTVELADDGSFAFTFTPPAEFSGQATFSYIVRDSDGLTATGQATVEVVPVNDVPTAPHVTLLPVAEDTQVVLTQAQLLAGASDVDGDALTAWYLRADSGSLWDNLDGTWTYQPGADDDGTVTFEYLVDDGYGSVMATASLDLTPVNDAPRIEQTVLPDATEDTSLVIDAAQLLAGATDVDSTELTVSGLAASSGTVVAIGDGSWRFTPGTDDDAGVVFTFLVGDGEHAVEASAMLDLLPVNDAPVAVADAIEMREDEAQYVWFETLLANDSDVDHDGMEVILVEDASHGSLSFEGGGVVFTPDADYHGIAGFTYTMRDASGLTSTASVAIDILAVNDDPVLAPDLVTGREDTQTVILAGELLANDTDRDSGELSIVDVYGDGNAIVELSEDGSSITFTPAAGYSGPASFYYQVSDGQSATWLGGEVVVNVAPVNDAPVTEADWLEAVEDTPVVFTATALLANDTDPEGSDLRLMGVTSVSGGSVQLTANGAVAFRPDADFAGTASFTYTVADAQGLHANGEATVDVRPVNDAPQVATVQLPALAEDGSRTLTRAQLLAGATDVEGDTLQVSGLVASTGTLVAQGVGVWLFRPRADDDSAVRFDYQVSDGQVAVAGAATLDLTSMPDAPVARDDAIVIQEDARPILLPSTLLANDTDADGDALTVVSVTNPSGSNVRATLNANGTITLVPRADFNGSSSFNYTVRDASGSTATATAQVRVQPVNDAPQAGNDAFTMVAGTSINLTSLLLANDVDPDGDVLRLFSASPDAARFSLQWVGQDLMLTALST
ncbi:MAG TPA: cadherin-like domain-containing protein, partial [Ramlibacter sp.]